MRLEGQSKLGYYPTPEQTLQLLLTWLSAPEAGLRRYLDPCCGKGEALAAIAAAHGPAETYGIELSDVRAAEARQSLTHVINTGYEYAVLTDETFSLVLLNPPYDGENVTGGGTRLEETFLVNTTSRLVPGGVLIYLIPQVRLNEKIARHLAGWCQDLRCFQLPAEEYKVFEQIIVFGIRRPDYQAPTGDALRAVQAWADGRQVTGYTDGAALEPQTPARKTDRRPVTAPLPALFTGHGEYLIPPSPLRGRHGAAFRFQYIMVSDDDMLHEAEDAAGRLAASREWRDLAPPTAPKTITPAMTPKKGHIGPQMLSGLLGTNRVRSPSDQQPMAIKGHIHKRRYTVQGDALEQLDDDLPLDDKKRRLLRIEVKEKFEAVMMTLAADGALTEHREPAEIGRLLEQHVRELAEVVQVRNVPRYDLKPDTWEWAVFDPLSRERRLPGRAETGLTDFQRHLAIAMGRLCLATGAGLVNAEMGSGKSTILLGVMEYLHEQQVARRGRAKRSPYPGLVVGPGIVTGQENWPKEIAEVIPGAASRVITVGVKPIAKSMRIGQWLAALGLRVEHEALFEVDPELAEQRYQSYRAALPGWLRALGVRLRQAGVVDAPAIKAKLLEAAVVAEAMAAVRALAREQAVELAPGAQTALTESFRRAARNLPRPRKGAARPNLLDGRLGGGYAWLGLDVPRDALEARELAAEYSLAQFAREYVAGLLPKKTFAILSFETAKLGAGRLPAMTRRTIRVERSEDETGDSWLELATVCACPHCGAVVSDQYDPQTGEPLRPITVAEAAKWVGSKRRFCKAPPMTFNPRTQRSEPGRWVYDAEKGRAVVRTHDPDGQAYLCGQPLFEDGALRREAAARYALRKLRGFFGLLAVDEIHKCKAKGTGVGWVLQVLNNASRYTVGLTGTLFGGYSTSIFWLLYRLSPEVRREFGFNDEQRWTEKYGLLKSVFYVSPDAAVTEDGTYTGTKHFETVSEMPGISPATVGLGLEYTTFSSLKDIGLPLPAYSEQVVRLPLTEAMQAQILEADGSQSKPPEGLLRWALEEQKREDGKGAISVWLNTALNRPDAMFRPEQVWFNRRVAGRGKYAERRKERVAEFGSIGAANETGEMPISELLPKEQWLARTCKLELLRGRRCLVYVRQTGERDIQPRLAEILRGHGLRPAILRPSLAPARRATWIKQNADKLDVLLTNSRLVEVGLNLTMFSTGIFFENEWSLYTIWQALRRLYRPGAPQPVQMYFPVYEGTLEESAINLLGAKMKAAQIFYGDEVGGALIEDEDDSDMLHGLLRQALGQVEVGRAEGLFGPGADQLVTGSPIGSPTAISPRLVTLMDLWAQRQTILNQARRRAGPKAHAEGQLAMF